MVRYCADIRDYHGNAGQGQVQKIFYLWACKCNKEMKNNRHSKFLVQSKWGKKCRNANHIHTMSGVKNIIISSSCIQCFIHIKCAACAILRHIWPLYFDWELVQCFCIMCCCVWLRAAILKQGSEISLIHLPTGLDDYSKAGQLLHQCCSR